MAVLAPNPIGFVTIVTSIVLFIKGIKSSRFEKQKNITIIIALIFVLDTVAYLVSSHLFVALTGGV